MDNKLIAAGIAGVVGLLLGMAVAPGGSDSEELSNALSGRFEQLSAEVQEVEDVAQEVRGGIVTLDERLVALEAASAANGVTLATVGEELTAQIDDRMAALDQTLGTRAQESRAATAAAMEILLAAVAAGASPPSQEQSAAGQGEPMAAAPAQPAGGQDQTTVAAVPAQSAPAQEMNRDIVAGMLYPTGRTMLAGEGIVRAYVSRVDPEAQIVTLSVNGTSTSLTPGQSVTAEADGQFCRVTLVGMRDRSAALDAACEPASSDGSGGQQQLVEGVAPGSVALLGDGAVRAFVSSVARDGSAARVAINGVLTQQVAPGEAVELDIEGQSCTVTVGSISGGRVSFDYGCGT